MDERSYTNFDLVIEQAGDRYRARVINSPAGQAAVEFDSLFSPLEVENFVLRMGRPKRGMRRIDSTEMETVRTFGTRLFRTVFSDDVYACYLRSLDSVLNQNRGLRIRLRIDVPAFHDLPWEYLYNPQVDQFLALSKDTPIVRYVELPYSTQALPIRIPIKILVMIASPAEYPPLDVEEEWARLNRALQPLIDQGLVVLKRLEIPTLSALQQQLRREQMHIFHFIGHGKYFEQQQDGMLLLEDENHRGRPTSGQQLGAILHDHHTLRLVVLNACEGARTSAEDPYTGVAQTLVRQGIPAVLAMQFEIFEEAAITLAQEFYGAIADGYPVDAALSEARKAIFAADNDVEWGTPVLFMRIPNGVLFRPLTAAEKAARLAAEQRAAEKAAREIAEREAAEKRAQEERMAFLDGLYDQAKGRMLQQDWAGAVESLAQIRETEPGFRDIAALLEQAETEREHADQVAGFLVKGKARFESGDWSGAMQVLQQLLALAPGHEEAQQLLGSARTRLKQEREERERQAYLVRLYEQARAKMAEGDWAGAAQLFEKIDQAEPDFRDVRELRKQARAEQDRREESVRLVARGKEYLAKQDWTRAIGVFLQALAMDPGRSDVQTLLVQAQRGEQVKTLFEAAQKDLRLGKLSEAVAELEAILEIDPAHVEAGRQLTNARIKLVHQAREDQAKRISEPGESISRPAKPVSSPSKPTSLPEEIKPRAKPGDLPK